MHDNVLFCFYGFQSDVRSVSGLEDMTVNLNVSCGRDVANLTATSGGLAVRALRLAQECSFLSLENGTNQTVLDYEVGHDGTMNAIINRVIFNKLLFSWINFMGTLYREKQRQEYPDFLLYYLNINHGNQI